jgi:hypothetical protein
MAAVDLRTGGIGGTGIYFYTTLVTLPPDGGYIGDVVFSNFVFTLLSGQAIPQLAIWQFSYVDNRVRLISQSQDYGTGSYKYTYTMSLYNPPVGQKFVSYKNFILSYQVGTNTYTKTLRTVAPGSVTGPSTSGGNPQYDGNVISFGANELGPLYYESVVSVTAGKIDGLYDEFTMMDLRTRKGPLPGFLRV